MAADPWWQNRPGSGYKTCSTCGNPYRASEGGCPNPGCYANPSITPERRASMKAAAKKREDEKKERDRLAEIRRKAMTGEWRKGR